MPFTEVFTALQQGTVDGFENPAAVFNSNHFDEVTKYLSLTGHAFTAYVPVMDLKKFNSYPANVQKVLLDTAQEASLYQRNLMYKYEDDSVAKLKAAGMKVNEVDKDAFVKEGVGHFASGWVWLAAEGETLKVLSTHDAEDLLVHHGLAPLLVCDLWEHAYYLDHKNDRKAFLEAWFDALPNWSFAQTQYDAARGQGEVWKHPPPIGSSQGTVALGAR